MLDTTTDELATAAGVRGLSTALAGAGVRLQQPGPANSRVLVAHSQGLVAADMDGGDPTVLVDDASGVPAEPVVVDGCRYAAWSSGTAWRRCGSDDPARLPLSGMPGGPTLRFAVNGANVALNDAVGGSSWAVQADGELIDNWDELITDDQQQEEQPQATDDTPPQLEEIQQPPVAVDDTFGARPGRASVLPVLLNDYDPNGDVLVVTSVDAIDDSVGRIDLVSRNQQLQLTLTAEASGTIVFGYSISDGRGGSASAIVTVEVRTPDQNSPPRQVR
ncbi:fibronectin type III domain-containing protein, partial [Schumannella luteola]